MRLAIELDGVRHEVETSQYAETATLADLVEAVCGTTVAGRRHALGRRLRAHRPTPGSPTCCCSRARGWRAPGSTPPQPVRGWAALVSGGLDAGRTVAVPTKRALFIGRSPQADLTVDSASASWSHATVEHAVETVGGEQEEPAEGRKKAKPEKAEGEPAPEPETRAGLRIKDEGSTNGTFVDGVKVPEEGHLRHRRGGRRGRRHRDHAAARPGRDAGSRSRQPPQRHHRRHRAVQPAAPAGPAAAAGPRRPARAQGPAAAQPVQHGHRRGAAAARGRDGDDDGAARWP